MYVLFRRMRGRTEESKQKTPLLAVGVGVVHQEALAGAIDWGVGGNGHRSPAGLRWGGPQPRREIIVMRA